MITNSTQYYLQKNILLSKYNVVSRLKFDKLPKLDINFSVKYSYRYIDEALFVFWLLHLITNSYAKVRFLRSKKKIIILTLNNISKKLLIVLKAFFYNRQTLKNLRNVVFIDKNENIFFYKYGSIRKFYCRFSSNFKQDNFEHVFQDLGANNLRLEGIIEFKFSKFKNEILKINDYVNFLQFFNYINIVKNYFRYKFIDKFFYSDKKINKFQIF